MTTQQSLPGGGVPLPPTQQTLQTSFDNGIWYALSLWPALHVAVSNGWGGPDSSDKKDWFAGAVSELFTSRPTTDQDDLEVFLVQVMQDEFECNVEDESEVEVTRTILRLKKTLDDGDLAEAKELERRWRDRGKMKFEVRVIDNEEDGDEEGDWEGFESEDEDVDMADDDTTPQLVEPKAKEKPPPEVDEDGFTKVVGKKRK